MTRHATPKAIDRVLATHDNKLSLGSFSSSKFSAWEKGEEPAEHKFSLISTNRISED